jgi:hypothetical protein
MTAEQAQVEHAKIKQEYEIRNLFRQVFANPNGIAVLAAIFNQAGYFSQNPDTLNKELAALCNWILAQMGSIHALNAFAFAEALIKIGNDDDLVYATDALTAQQEE